jgi:hypothetical protein
VSPPSHCQRHDGFLCAGSIVTQQPAAASSSSAVVSSSSSSAIIAPSSTLVDQTARTSTGVSSPLSSAAAAAGAATSTRGTNVGAIAGGVIGGLAALALLIIGVCLVQRRGRRNFATGGSRLPDSNSGGSEGWAAGVVGGHEKNDGTLALVCRRRY